VPGVRLRNCPTGLTNIHGPGIDLTMALFADFAARIWTKMAVKCFVYRNNLEVLLANCFKLVLSLVKNDLRGCPYLI